MRCGKLPRQEVSPGKCPLQWGRGPTPCAVRRRFFAARMLSRCIRPRGKLSPRLHRPRHFVPGIRSQAWLRMSPFRPAHSMFHVEHPGPRCRAEPCQSVRRRLHGVGRLSHPANGPSCGLLVPRMATALTLPRRSGRTASGETARSSAQSAVPSQSAIRRSSTLTFRHPRVASLRNDAFRRLDSTSVTCADGRRTATGTPGKPAPDPTSTTDAIGGSSL